MAVGLPVRFESGLYDAAALVVDGRVVGLACKQHLAGEGIHYEPRWFRPWQSGRRAVLVERAHAGQAQCEVAAEQVHPHWHSGAGVYAPEQQTEQAERVSLLPD